MLFTLQKVRELDHKKIILSGVYRIYSNDKVVNYVGISKNILSRWKNHMRKSNKKDLSSKIDHKYIEELNFEVLFACKSTFILKKLERYYIDKYDSFYNGQNGDHGGSLTALPKEIAKKGGIASASKKAGVHGLTLKQKQENSRKAGTRAKELSKGIHGLNKEIISQNGKKGGLYSKYIWKILLKNKEYTSLPNEGLERLCQRINLPYYIARKAFYEYGGFYEKKECKVHRIDNN